MVGFGIGGIGRDGDAADRHHREIRDQPFGTVFGDDDDTVAGAEAEALEAGGQPADVVGDLAPAERPIAAVALGPDERPIAEALGLGEEHGDQIGPRQGRKR